MVIFKNELLGDILVSKKAFGTGFILKNPPTHHFDKSAASANQKAMWQALTKVMLTAKATTVLDGKVIYENPVTRKKKKVPTAAVWLAFNLSANTNDLGIEGGRVVGDKMKIAAFHLLKSRYRAKYSAGVIGKMPDDATIIKIVKMAGIRPPFEKKPLLLEEELEAMGKENVDYLDVITNALTKAVNAHKEVFEQTYGKAEAEAFAKNILGGKGASKEKVKQTRGGKVSRAWYEEDDLGSFF